MSGFPSRLLAGYESFRKNRLPEDSARYRILAETGLRPMLRGLLREIVDNPSPKRVLKLRGKWTEVAPSLFDPTMRVKDLEAALEALQTLRATQPAPDSAEARNRPMLTMPHRGSMNSADAVARHGTGDEEEGRRDD